MKWTFLIAIMLLLVFTFACAKKPAVVEQTIIPTDTVLPVEESDRLTDCFRNNGAEMYGTSWCPHCQRQKAMFGESWQKMTYFDCDLQKDICDEKKIEGYPTWIINGTYYSGEQTWDKLKKATGCE